jgi:hypothetical protein
MQYWMTYGIPSATQAGPNVYVNFTPAYTELFLPASYFLSSTGEGASRLNETFLVFYASEFESNRWLILSPWEGYFDFWWHLMGDQGTGIGFRKAVAESCPIYWTLLQRATEPLNHDFALSRMNDIDHNRQVWVLSAVFGNTVIESVDQFVEGRSLAVITRMVELNVDLIKETYNGPLAVPNALNYIAKQASRDEMTKFMRQSAQFAKDYGPLLKLLT